MSSDHTNVYNDVDEEEEDVTTSNQKHERLMICSITDFEHFNYRIVKVCVNNCMVSMQVREVTEVMYINNQLQENITDCFVLVYAVDNKQSFGKILFILIKSDD